MELSHSKSSPVSGPSAKYALSSTFAVNLFHSFTVGKLAIDKVR